MTATKETIAANRRRGNRKSVKGEHAYASLMHRGKRIPVLVFNEGTGGIGVICVNPPTMSIGAIVHFETNTRKADCRVTGIQNMESIDAIICRLGLEWID